MNSVLVVKSPIILNSSTGSTEKCCPEEPSNRMASISLLYPSTIVTLADLEDLYWFFPKSK